MKFSYRYLVTVLIISGSLPVAAEITPTQQLLNEYSDQGVTEFSVTRGKALWARTVNERSCGTCHTSDPKAQGRHQKTNKPIAALAPSINAKRLQKTKTIRKWLKRNCKWTLGRECTSQEKGDFLTWLQQQ